MEDTKHFARYNYSAKSLTKDELLIACTFDGEFDLYICKESEQELAISEIRKEYLADFERLPEDIQIFKKVN